MKKTLIVLALAMVSFANAQKGSILVAGNLGLDFSKNEVGTTETKGTEFSLSPKVGYQFNDHWTFGIEASVSMDNTESTTFTGFTRTSTENKMTGFSVGPFARYSMPLSETFSVFADMGVGFHSRKNTTENNNGFITTSTTQKGDGFYVGVTPALFINMKKNFGINFSIGGLGYRTLNYDLAGGDSNEFYLNFGQTVNIGVSKNF